MYAPARRAGRVVVPLIAEVFGGLSPHPTRFLRQLSRVAAKYATRDSTRYSRCARTFRTFHGQRISHAIVMTDALNIQLGILKFKKNGPIVRPSSSSSSLFVQTLTGQTNAHDFGVQASRS